MAILKDRGAHEELMKRVGRRLKAARVATRMTLEDAAKALGHKNLTQVSLAENGQRLPPLLSLIKMADLYAVSLDYLTGRIEDPISEAGETHQGLVTRMVVACLDSKFGTFAKTMGEYVSTVVLSKRDDRDDIRALDEVTKEFLSAYRRLKELNPELEQDWRGGARVETAAQNIDRIMQKVYHRFEHERRTFAAMELDPSTQSVGKELTQYLLPLRA